MKVCLKCKIEKELSDFNKDKRNKSGYNTQCKSCVSLRRSRINNPIISDHKLCNKCNIIKESSSFKKQKDSSDGLYHMCKDCFNDWRKEYRKSESVRLKELEYREINKDYYKEYNKNWKENNKDKVIKYNKTSNNNPKRKEYLKTYNKKYFKSKRENDIIYKLKTNLRNSIRMFLMKNGYCKNKKTIHILGTSFDEFKSYLESKFEPWMSWENYGRYNGETNYGWDIDHIIPLSSVDNEEDLIRLCHFTNLQPLCSYTNRYIKKDNLL